VPGDNCVSVDIGNCVWAVRQCLVSDYPVVFGFVFKLPGLLALLRFFDRYHFEKVIRTCNIWTSIKNIGAFDDFVMIFFK
jgi:hypothetical protein